MEPHNLRNPMTPINLIALSTLIANQVNNQEINSTFSTIFTQFYCIEAKLQGHMNI